MKIWMFLFCLFLIGCAQKEASTEARKDNFMIVGVLHDNTVNDQIKQFIQQDILQKYTPDHQGVILVIEGMDVAAQMFAVNNLVGIGRGFGEIYTTLIDWGGQNNIPILVVGGDDVSLIAEQMKYIGKFPTRDALCQGLKKNREYNVLRTGKALSRAMDMHTQFPKALVYVVAGADHFDDRFPELTGYHST